MADSGAAAPNVSAVKDLGITHSAWMLTTLGISHHESWDLAAPVFLRFWRWRGEETVASSRRYVYWLLSLNSVTKHLRERETERS